jgi:hypothetical protein
MMAHFATIDVSIIPKTEKKIYIAPKTARANFDRTATRFDLGFCFYARFETCANVDVTKPMN